MLRPCYPCPYKYTNPETKWSRHQRQCKENIKIIFIENLTELPKRFLGPVQKNKSMWQRYTDSHMKIAIISRYSFTHYGVHIVPHRHALHLKVVGVMECKNIMRKDEIKEAQNKGIIIELLSSLFTQKCAIDIKSF